MSRSVCQVCGKPIVGKEFYIKRQGMMLSVCPTCYNKYRAVSDVVEEEYEMLYPELVAVHSPLSMLTIRGIGFREAYIPLGITIKKGEREIEASEAERPIRYEEIDWVVLAGAEPIDELKDRGVAHVLAASYAASQGQVTAKDVAHYLSEKVRSMPELEQHLDRFKNINEDAAREVLNELTEMGILVKEARKGARGANIYRISEEKSWYKEEF